MPIWFFSTLSAESTAHTSTSSVIKAEPCNVPAKPPMTTNSIPASASRFSNTCSLCIVVSSGFSQLPSKCQRSLVSRSSVIVGESQVRIHQTQIEPGPLGLLDSFVVGILFSKSVHDGPARNEHFSANHRRRSRSPAHGFIRYVKKSRSAASSIPASNPSGIRETGSAVRLAIFSVRAPCIWPARSRTVAPCAPCFTSSPSRVSPLVNVSV